MSSNFFFLLRSLQRSLVFFLAVIQSLHSLQVVQPLLESALLQVLLGHGEEIAQVQEYFPVDAHEAGLHAVLGRAEANVRLQIANDLIVTEYRVWRQKHEVLDQELVEHRDCTFLDEVDLTEFLTIVYYSKIRLINSCKHIDDQFVEETSFTVFKEMLEVQLKVLENSIHNLSLHLWWNLLIEVEFFNNKVEIIHKCIMHVLLDITV